jgi:glyoxylase-like metal-dependent hydrolase (beta-lactamase superfamily II)
VTGRPDEAPHPPATPEFGHVTVGGAAHSYPGGSESLRITKLAVGPFDNNVYVVASNGQALIVDGAAEPERLLREVHGIHVSTIVQTHNHPDHTSALHELSIRLPAPVLGHTADPLPVRAGELADGDRIDIGNVEVRVLHTPGHTPGSLCFLVEGFLFSGDTLFPGGPGNTWGESAAFEEIMRSLDRLFELPDETRVCPGHGLDTTIGRERPYLEVWRRRGW